MKKEEFGPKSIIGTIWITPSKGIYIIAKFSGPNDYIMMFLNRSDDDYGVCIGKYKFDRIIQMIDNDKYVGNIADLDLDSLIAERLNDT